MAQGNGWIEVRLNNSYGYTSVICDGTYPFSGGKEPGFSHWRKVGEITEDDAKALALTGRKLGIVDHNWFLNKGYVIVWRGQGFEQAVYLHDFKWYQIERRIEL